MHWDSFDPGKNDITCFELLKWAAYNDGRLSIYPDVMRGRKPCPLKDICKKGIEAQTNNKKFVWDLPKQLELFA